MGDKTNKLNVCLIKSEYTRFDEIVDPDTTGHEIDGVGTFYMEDSQPRSPDWLRDFFGSRLRGKLHLVTSTAKGVLLVKLRVDSRPRIFAVVFGYGRSLLNDGVIEDRFGLKIVLNTVDPNSLRSIDKTTLGSVPKQSREQVSRESVAANFGLDIEQDLINSVTGRSKITELGRTITGRDAFIASVKVDILNIKEFLRLCFRQYDNEAYKEDFGWIDQIKEIRNPAMIQVLNSRLVKNLRTGDLEKIWMAPPEVLEWVDVKGFRYVQRKRADLRPDLDLAQFLASIDGASIDLDLLKNTPVFVISTKTDQEMMRWSAYKCIYAEIEHQGRICVLNNGKWYEITKNFASEVNGDFQRTPNASISLPDYRHADEGAYNASLPASVPHSHSMDRNLISYGGGHSTIEYCDLVTEDKKLIHIKRYGGSAQLSHLFAQGVVSGELLVQDETFRKKVNEKLPPSMRLRDVRQRPNASEYEIIFAVISKSAKPLEIPFFSKVSLRNARRRLLGYGYKVSKKKISIK